MPGHLSIHLKGEIPRQEIGDVLDAIARVTGGKYLIRGELAGVRSLFSVASVTSRRGTATIVLYAPMDSGLVQSLIPLVGGNNLTLVLGVPSGIRTGSTDLRVLLETAARKKGIPPEDLLEKLTTFQAKDGRVVRGKRDLSMLSEQQSEVVRDKLLKIVYAEGFERATGTSEAASSQGT